MAIVVEHDKRRKEILQKSLDVFVQEGYEDVTFQKIADRCGITRTTLYIYFSNKQENFQGSLKELLLSVENEILTFINNEELTAEEALRRVLKRIIELCVENKTLFQILLSYLLQIKKSGVDVNQRIKRRVVRVRHHLSTLIIRGINDQEFKKEKVKDMIEFVYGIIESAIFRLSVAGQSDISELFNVIDLAVDGFLLQKK